MDGILSIIAGAFSGVWGLVAGLFSPAPDPADFVEFSAQPQTQIEEPAPRNIIQPGTAIDATPEARAYVEDKKQKNLMDISATPKKTDGDGDGDGVTVLRE